MRRLLVTLPDELSKKLEAYPNQSAVVREALELYISDITPATLQGLRTSYELVRKDTKEINAKLDYLAREIK